MAARSQRLGALQRVAEKRVDDAARGLSAARARLEGERQQLQQLSDYRAEYAAQLTGRQLDAARLCELRAFLGRLTGAIDQQATQIASAEAEFRRARDRWLALRGREQALGKVVERARGEELLADGRREQLASDARSNRRGGA